MTICPYCEQGIVLKAKIKKLKINIRICPECDTIWKGDIKIESGCDYGKYMERYGLSNSWDELEIIE